MQIHAGGRPEETPTHMFSVKQRQDHREKGAEGGREVINLRKCTQEGNSLGKKELND